MQRIGLFLLAGILFPLSVLADIGEVGNPNLPKPVEEKEVKEADTPKEAAIAVPAPEKPAADSKPLLIIRFNQKNVDYDRSIEKAIREVRRAKPDGAYFRVVSLLPLGKTPQENEKITLDSVQNLAGVYSSMLQNGAKPDRINASTTSKEGIKSQEIHIFVE